MRIAPVTRDQFATWRRLRGALYTGLDARFHDEEMGWLFQSKEAASFLAWSKNGDAIGLLELSLRNFVDGCIGSPVGYIDGIYVEPSCRGQGLGPQLIAYATDWFRARGCKDMATDAEIENAAAQDFYRQLGFSERWHVVGFTKSLTRS
jgi:aminoglycoside 6'-N-acetyltransferase I